MTGGRLIAVLGAFLARVDGVLRTWEVAGLSLLLLVLVLAAGMLLER